ncbi:MAG: hypothetical protein MZV49_13725 [Rhodopseudomonas palustris]|nr:hypothetical protein [Rhodopseudomonas palustris]
MGLHIGRNGSERGDIAGAAKIFVERGAPPRRSPAKTGCSKEPAGIIKQSNG